MKQNCWQMKACGREPGGSKAGQMGVCPAAKDKEHNGINGGVNGGRICWAVAGTFCGGIVQGTFAEKQASCLACDIYKKVKQEEGSSFHLMLPGQTYHRAQKASV
ncbi:MAG: hypothetical protein M1343_12570 [Chloroflexi bacterium]|nr:hypothetical protein [Chloroflexota bacterium]